MHLLQGRFVALQSKVHLRAALDVFVHGGSIRSEKLIEPFFYRKRLEGKRVYLIGQQLEVQLSATFLTQGCAIRKRGDEFHAVTIATAAANSASGTLLARGLKFDVDQIAGLFLDAGVKCHSAFADFRPPAGDRHAESTGANQHANWEVDLVSPRAARVCGGEHRLAALTEFSRGCDGNQ